MRNENPVQIQKTTDPQVRVYFTRQRTPLPGCGQKDIVNLIYEVDGVNDCIRRGAYGSEVILAYSYCWEEVEPKILKILGDQ